MPNLSSALVRFDRTFYKTAAVIAVPVMVQHIISISLNMVDTMMIGSVGVNELAGVGAANRVYFVFMVICFGFFSGTSIHLSQYWGVKDVTNVRRLVGLDYAFVVILSLITMGLSYAFAPQILTLFSDEPEVILYGSQYLRISLFAYIFNAMTCVMSFNSRSIHQLTVPTTVNALALGLNTFLNYCLIFGNFGLPKLGVEGAAIATVTARVIEFFLLRWLIYRNRSHPLAGSIRELRDFDWALVRRVSRKALPALTSETVWSVGNAVYYMAYGEISPAAIAVGQASAVICDLFQSLFFGLGSASAVMVGNELGRKRQDLAYSYGRRFLFLTLGFTLVMVLLFWLLKMPIVRFFDLEGDASPLLAATLNVYIIFLLPRMMTYTLFIGILRAGGDANFCMILDVLGVWCVGVPLAFIGAKVLCWDLPAVVALSLVEEIFKLFLCLRRMKQKRWLQILV